MIPDGGSETCEISKTKKKLSKNKTENYIRK